MCSVAETCFMCSNTNNCKVIDEKIVKQVEYALPEITIVKKGIPLSICTNCSNFLQVFNKFKHESVENCQEQQANINAILPIPRNQTAESENHNQQNEKQTVKTCTETTVEEEIKSGTDNTKNKRILQCPLCYKIFKIKSNLDSHLKSHREVKKFQCNHCYKIFALKSLLKKHLEAHNLTNTETTASSDDVVQETNNEGKIKKCPLCNEQFTKIENLKIHIKCHAGLKRFRLTTEFIKSKQCPICDKKFSKFSSDVIKHIKIHMGGVNLSCTTCKKTFSSRPALKYHMSIHMGIIKSFKCSVCPKTYRARSDLRKHMKSQDNEHLKAFEAGYLKKPKKNIEQTTENQLPKEEISLQEEPEHKKSRKCPICNDIFTQTDELDNHMKKYKDVKKLSFNEKIYKTKQCPICDKMLKSSWYVIQHLKSVHIGIKPFQCLECNKTFTVKESLEYHITNHTGARNFKCPVCHKSYRVNSILRKHMKQKGDDDHLIALKKMKYPQMKISEESTENEQKFEEIYIKSEPQDEFFSDSESTLQIDTENQLQKEGPTENQLQIVKNELQLYALDQDLQTDTSENQLQKQGPSENQLQVEENELQVYTLSQDLQTDASEIQLQKQGPIENQLQEPGSIENQLQIVKNELQVYTLGQDLQTDTSEIQLQNQGPTENQLQEQDPLENQLQNVKNELQVYTLGQDLQTDASETQLHKHGLIENQLQEQDPLENQLQIVQNEKVYTLDEDLQTDAFENQLQKQGSIENQLQEQGLVENQLQIDSEISDFQLQTVKNELQVCILNQDLEIDTSEIQLQKQELIENQLQEHGLVENQLQKDSEILQTVKPELQVCTLSPQLIKTDTSETQLQKEKPLENQLQIDNEITDLQLQVNTLDSQLRKTDTSETQLQKEGPIIENQLQENSRKCPICTDIFTNAADLEQHMKKYKTVKKLYFYEGFYKSKQCPVCDKVFKNISCNIIRHVKISHIGIKDYHCSECNRSFTSKDSLEFHLTKHTGIKNFTCSVCDKSYQTKKVLRKHMKAKGDYVHLKVLKEMKINDKNPDLINNYPNTRLSEQTEHNVEEIDIKNEPLDYLSDTEEISIKEETLQKNDNVQNSLCCPVCSKTFLTEQELVFHLKKHEEIISDNDSSISIDEIKIPHTQKTDLENHENKDQLQIDNKISDFQLQTVKPELQICSESDTSETQLQTVKKMCPELRKDDKITSKQEKSRKCPICTDIFTNAADLEQHMKKYKNVKKLAFYEGFYKSKQCPVCDKVFKSICNVIRHVKITHIGIKDYHCSECNRSFTSKDSLEFHSTKHTGVKNFTCPICDKSYQTKKVLRKHMKGKGDYVHLKALKEMKINDKNPDLNNEYPNTRLSKQTAENTEHQFEEIYIKNEPQDLSDSEGTSQKNDKSTKEKRVQNTLSCPVCSKTFLTQQKLVIHLKKHEEINSTSDSSISSDETELDITSSENIDQSSLSVADCLLKKVEQMHKDHENITKNCPFCDETFLEFSSEMKEHVKSHIGTDYHCTTCNKTFTNRTSFKYHMSVHLGIIENYKCPLCPKSYRAKNDLRKHMRKEDDEHLKLLRTGCLRNKPTKKKNNEAQILSVEEDFDDEGEKNQLQSSRKCPICGEEFPNGRALGKHIKEHSDLKNITFNKDLITSKQCLVCDKVIKCIYNMTRHLKTHIGFKEFNCSECQKPFSTKDSLEYHMAIHTGAKDFKCAVCHKSYRTNNILKKHMRKKGDESHLKALEELNTNKEYILKYGVNYLAGKQKKDSS